jgi:hypothetical protein
VPAFAAVQPPFERVRRIAVLRGGGLGDLLFAMPAMDALAAAYPDAELILLGSPVHAELLRGRPSSVSRVEVLPVARGVREVAGEYPDAARTAQFRARVRRGGAVDLGVQLHGGGRNSNPFLLALDPRHSVGSATEDAPPLERTLRYVYYQHEVMRGIEVAGLAGAEPVVLEPRDEGGQGQERRERRDGSHVLVLTCCDVVLMAREDRIERLALIVDQRSSPGGVVKQVVQVRHDLLVSDRHRLEVLGALAQ